MEDEDRKAAGHRKQTAASGPNLALGEEKG